jgi:hypothetical protein
MSAAAMPYRRKSYHSMIVPTILAKKTRRISSGEEFIAPTTVLAMVATFWANINILAPWVKPGQPGNDVRDLVSTREFKSVDLANITHDLKERGIILKCTEQAVDTSDASGTMFMNMLMVFAEFETNIRKERQLEGIAKAKAAGVYKGKGRPKSVDITKVRELAAKGWSKTDIAAELEIGRASVYRVIRPG